MTSFSDYFNIYTYKDPLIFFKVENFDSWAHRDLAVRKDYFLKRFINGLDVGIFQENPIFEPDILHSKDADEKAPTTEGDSIEPTELKLEPTFKDKSILEDWNKEKWKDLCVRMWDAARTHKFCVVQLYNKPPWWRVFTYREIHHIEYDKQDLPTKVHCLWTKSLPLAHKFLLHDENINLIKEDAKELNENGKVNSLGLFINWGVDIDENINSNDLEQVWSLDIQLRYILNDIISNSAKSSGFYWVTYGSGVSDEIQDDIVNAFELCSASKVIGATEQTIAKIEAMYPKNPEFSIEAMDKIMKVFSGATGLPYLFFNGEKDTSGVFEENSSAKAQVNDKKREVFGQLKQYLLKLVEMRWGIVCEDVFPNIAEEESESFDEDIIDKRGTPGSDKTGSEIKKMRLQT